MRSSLLFALCAACNGETHAATPPPAEPMAVRAVANVADADVVDPCEVDDKDGCAEAAVRAYYAPRSSWGDRHDAKKQLQTLCDRGHAGSCFVLADILANDSTDPVEEPGVPAKKLKAWEERVRALYRRACELGDARGCNRK